MENIYYTYAYLRKDRTPYYIGRGKGNRAYGGNHNVPVPPRERVLFLKKGLTYAESTDHERYMIAIYGRKDQNTGILRNRTDGGDGSPGFRFSEEQLKHRQEIQTGRKASKAHRQNISEGMKRVWANGHNNNARRGPRPDAGMKGQEHPMSKITDDDRREIAALWVGGGRGGSRYRAKGNTKELSELYGISCSRVKAIANDPRWTS